MISIIISSHNRLGLFRRTLYALKQSMDDFTGNTGHPAEVILCDDGSEAEEEKGILAELRSYSGLSWKFIRVDRVIYERETGQKIFWNNPAWTNNVAFKHSQYPFVFQQGNEVIVSKLAYRRLWQEAQSLASPGIRLSTTFDVPLHLLDKLDRYGTELSNSGFYLKFLGSVQEWPLQSVHYRSDVTNYLSVTTREVWEDLGGYDERYLGGISGEDSDFVRRVRAIGGAMEVSDVVSFHQSHGGKTRYYQPKPSVISRVRFEEGCKINRKLYESWTGSDKSGQSWPWGEIGVVDVIAN